MKKQYCVSFIIITLLLITSCASLRTNDETLVNTALNLANKYCELKQYEDALDVYNKALTSGYDYRLLYNKCLVQAKMENYVDAISTAELGYKLYDKTDFQILIAEFYYYSNQTEKAYNLALDLWENGLDSKRIVSILYSVNPEEWAMINKVIN